MTVMLLEDHDGKDVVPHLNMERTSGKQIVTRYSQESRQDAICCYAIKTGYSMFPRGKHHVQQYIKDATLHKKENCNRKEKKATVWMAHETANARQKRDPTYKAPWW